MVRAFQTMGTACVKARRMNWRDWRCHIAVCGGEQGEDGKAQITQRALAKLKSLNLILEAAESHGGIFSGFMIQISLAEQKDGLQGVWAGSREQLKTFA